MNDLSEAYGVLHQRLSNVLVQPGAQPYQGLARVYLDVLNRIPLQTYTAPNVSVERALLYAIDGALSEVRHSDVVRTIRGAYCVLGILSALPGTSTSVPIVIPPPPDSD